MANTPTVYTIGNYRERLAYFKDTDTEKVDMINDLIENLEKSRREYHQTLLDLDSERAERRRHQDRVKELETLTSGRSFVLVLIDADADDYIFRESFINNDEEGGREAADELYARIKDHLKELKLDADNTKIVVRAFADVKNLQAACTKNGKMRIGSSLSSFAHGFNQRQGLFDFVDVGVGKEATDNKIRECLSFYLDNWQCRHIIFGACHDSGYAPFLGQFAADPVKRNRITLLQGARIHPRIGALGFGRSLQLESVFAPHRSAVLPAPSIPITSVVGASQGRGFTNPSPLSERLGPVLRNEEGKRVDKKLKVDVRSGYLNVLRDNKLCQYYYLRGRCEGCDKNHVPPPLKAKEFDCLWYVARSGMCYKIKNGKDCDDPLCVYMHEKVCQIGSANA